MKVIAIFILAVFVVQSQGWTHHRRNGAPLVHNDNEYSDNDNGYSDEDSDSYPTYSDDDTPHDLEGRPRLSQDEVLAIIAAIAEAGYNPWTDLFTFHGKKGKKNVGTFRKWLGWGKWDSNSFTHSNP